MLRTLALTWLGFKCLRTNPLFHRISFRSVPPFRVKNGPIGEVLPLPRWVGWSDYEGDGALWSPRDGRSLASLETLVALIRPRTCHEHHDSGGNESR